jgi:hypothetical protein
VFPTLTFFAQAHFSAHTFRVQPGFENDDMKAGQDIHVKWTATSGNVSITFSKCELGLMNQGLVFYIQRLEWYVIDWSRISNGERSIGVEEYGRERCSSFLVKHSVY